MQVPYGSFQNTSRPYIAVGGNEQLTELMSIKDLVSHNLLHGYGFGEYVLFFQENLFLKERQIGVIVYRLYLVVLQLIPVYQAGDRFQFIFRMHPEYPRDGTVTGMGQVSCRNIFRIHYDCCRFIDSVPVIESQLRFHHPFHAAGCLFMIFQPCPQGLKL